MNAVNEASDELRLLYNSAHGCTRIELNTVIEFTLDLDAGTLSVRSGEDVVVLFQGLKGPMIPIAYAYNDKVTINIHDIESSETSQDDKVWLKNFSLIVEVSFPGTICARK